MKYYIVGDTHFGHENIKKYCDRPDNYNELIIDNWKKIITNEDVVIHLGDVCFGRHNYWHNIIKSLPGRFKILCLGNHDHKSINWYLNNGWNFACTRFAFDYLGKEILFSHEHIINSNYDLNVHAHSHNSDVILDYDEYLFVLEHNYKPILLDSIIKQYCYNK